ncbi:MAG TPA: hypothetical protein VLN59_07850 [Burkholderiales bacterium]|nr:hypothetical protein [Burkholderiales bacterium]
MTARVRPAQRHRSVIDSLNSLAMRGGTDTLRVRASDPQIRGETATISVTVDGRVSASSKRHFYETVAFVLRRDGTRWVIRSRTQIGVS